MRLSIFTTVFIVFLVVVSPLYFIGILMFNTAQNNTKMEIYSSTLNNVDFFVSNIENEIKRIISAEVVLINNEDIRDISSLDEIPYDFEVYKKIENILYELSLITNYSRYIQQAYVLFPASGLKVTNRSRQTMTEFDYQCAYDGDFINGYPFNNHSSGTYINFTSEFHRQTPLPNKITYIIVTKINTDLLVHEMNEYFEAENDQTGFLGGIYGLNAKEGIDESALPEIREFVNSAPRKNDKSIDSLHLDSVNKSVLIASRYSSYLKTTFVLFNEEQRFLSSLQKYKYWIWILTGAMLTLVIIFTLWTRRIIAVPMNRLISAINRGLKGDLNNTIEYRSNEEFMYIYRQFNNMLQVQKSAINQLYERDLLVKDAELKMLQYQINPHFLYNCFFLMYQMLQAADYETAQKMLFHMGNYFNFVTKSENFIPLGNEMKFCADYIEIQGIRFSRRITAGIEEIPEEFKSLIVPRIIIQPIIENCYKHGLANKESNGIIEVRFNRERGSITVEDNGDELTDKGLLRIKDIIAKEQPEVMSGLWNVNRRLRSYFGEEYGLSMSRGRTGGLLVEITLPILSGS